MTTIHDICQAFPDLLLLLEGDPKTQITGSSPQTGPKAQTVVFVGDEKLLTSALSSPAAALVVSEKVAATAKANAQGKVILQARNTYLSMALVNSRFFVLPFYKKPFAGQMIHPTAIIAASAKLGKDVSVGPLAVIHEDVTIDSGTYIGSHVVIEPKTSLGENCYIHPHVYIGHTCQIGHRVEIKPMSVIGSDGFGFATDEKGHHHKIPHYGPVIIGDDVNIGANVNIDRGTYDAAVIGAGTKIDNHCHFGHNVRIGKNCLLTAGFVSAGSSSMGDNCITAGRTSLNGHTHVTNNVTMGPLSTITNDITKPGVYAGFPPIGFRDSLKAQASIQHLPRIRKNVAKIMKHLGLADDDKGN